MRNSLIQKMAGTLLLLLFVLSNTPTMVLHTMFADHRDQPAADHARSADAGVAATGLDCHCITNVVTDPTIPSVAAVPHSLPLVLHIQNGAPLSSVQSETVVSIFQRGPPVLS